SAIFCRGQVIQRTEQQDDIKGRIGKTRVTCVANRAGRERACARRTSTAGFVDEARHDVNQVDGIARAGEPERIRTGGASDVGDGRWRSRRESLDQLARAERFEEKRPLFEARLLSCLLVEIRNRLIEFGWPAVHGKTSP